MNRDSEGHEMRNSRVLRYITDTPCSRLKMSILRVPSKVNKEWEYSDIK